MKITIKLEDSHFLKTFDVIERLITTALKHLHIKDFL